LFSGIDVVPSSETIAAPLSGSHRYSNAGVRAGDESSARIL
jgi:hypothetical protein